MVQQNIYNLPIIDAKGNETTLGIYKHKVMLIVNTASKCGFTPQLKELEELYKQYKDQGLVVIGFPCNDFGEQEPLNGNEIQQFCERHFQTSFPIYGKVSIKGANKSPIYKHLGSYKQTGKLSLPPLWNFHKYLVAKDGRLVDFFLPITSPLSGHMKRKIEKALGL